MILNRVTFTGADDSVDPGELRKISDVYPFVEWGILYSHKQLGNPRFPSEAWMRALVSGSNRPPQLAMHLCGAIVRNMCMGEFEPPPVTWSYDYQRIQLNFHAEPHPVIPAHFKALLSRHFNYLQTIFQMDGVNDDLFLLARNWMGMLCTAALFDTSHGAGLSPESWPEALPRTYCGYAGGIGPGNVLPELERIARVAGSNDQVWIDMEGKIRSADNLRFDLDAVRGVCEQVKSLIGLTYLARP